MIREKHSKCDQTIGRLDPDKIWYTVRFDDVEFLKEK